MTDDWDDDDFDDLDDNSDDWDDYEEEDYDDSWEDESNWDNLDDATIDSIKASDPDRWHQTGDGGYINMDDEPSEMPEYPELDYLDDYKPESMIFCNRYLTKEFGLIGEGYIIPVEPDTEESLLKEMQEDWTDYNHIYMQKGDGSYYQIIFKDGVYAKTLEVSEDFVNNLLYYSGTMRVELSGEMTPVELPSNIDDIPF